MPGEDDADRERNPAEEVDEMARKIDELNVSAGGASSSENESEDASEEGESTGEGEDRAGAAGDDSDDDAPEASEKASERRMPAPDLEGPSEPGVLLDAPEVSIDELDLTVEELDFQFAPPGEEGEEEEQPGTSVHLGKVELHVKGVLAEAHLQVNLRDITGLLQTLDGAALDGAALDGAARDGGAEEDGEAEAAGEAAGQVTEAAGQAREAAGDVAEGAAGEEAEGKKGQDEEEAPLGGIINDEGTIAEDALDEAVSQGIEAELIERNGSWYSYRDETIGQGQGAVVRWLQENEDARVDLAEQLRLRNAVESGEPVVTERTDDEGRTVRRVRDPSGAVTFEYVLEEGEVQSLNVVEE